ncbi:MAG: hypothetical protein ACD_63C00106G0012 [uncultured bacterium]|nr:MAG: hypothetical protein ACD_63C00106G0012 [uncultured bacterium]
MALSLLKRRIIISLLVLLFFVTAPALILYAKGYRYNFEENKIQKVGMIMIAHNPTTAVATVNGKSAPFDITTLGYERFSNLLPGKYHAKVEMPEYILWEKEFEVIPEFVTWARYVTLFYSQPTQTKIKSDSKITNFVLSPDKKNLFFIKKGEDENNEFIENFKVSNQRIDELTSDEKLLKASTTEKTTAKIEIEKLYPSPDSSKILISSKMNGKPYYSILTIDEPEKIHNIENLSTKEDFSNIEEIKWHPTSNNRIYLKNEKGLYFFDLSEEKLSKKIASNVLAFEPSNYGLFFIKSDVVLKMTEGSEHSERTSSDGNEIRREELKSSLKKMDLDGKNPETISEDFEYSDNYSIEISAEGKKAVLTKEGALYSIKEPMEKSIANETKAEIKRIALDIKNIEWSMDNDEEESTGELLLYSNDHEIFTYEPQIENSETITRYSSKINTSIWYPGNYKYVIFVIDRKLKIIELDERDKRNVADVFEFPDGTELGEEIYIDNDSENLYFLTKDKKDKNIIQLTIR